MHTLNTLSNRAPARGFAPSEYQRRCNAVQSNMREQAIDVLWLSGEADILYLTGFLTQFWQSPTRPWHLLLPQSGSPVAVIPSIGEVCMQRTWVSDIRCWSSPDPIDDGVSLLASTIRELAGATPRIGLPMAAESYVRTSFNDITKLRAALAGCDWVDCSSALRSVRQIKSVVEIEKLGYICSVTSDAFAQVPDLVLAGMTQSAAFKAFKLACLAYGADDCAYLVGAARAEGYSDIISPPSEKIISIGDVLMLDTGCVYDGYYSDFDRNFAFAHVDKATQSAHQRVWDATEAGLSCVSKGATCADVFNAMQAVLATSNTESSVGRLGHGLGIELTETPSIAAFDHTPLKAGMVMTLEPALNYGAEKIMVHEENLVVTETGYALLSRRATRDITIIS